MTKNSSMKLILKFKQYKNANITNLVYYEKTRMPQTIECIALEIDFLDKNTKRQ